MVYKKIVDWIDRLRMNWHVTKEVWKKPSYFFLAQNKKADNIAIYLRIGKSYPESTPFLRNLYEIFKQGKDFPLLEKYVKDYSIASKNSFVIELRKMLTKVYKMLFYT